MKQPIIMTDGNEATASVAHRSNEVIAIYPITPSSEWENFLTNGLPKERRTFGEPPHSLSKCNQKAARRELCMVRFKQAH